MGKRVAFLSLGCDKNRVDSEYMLGLLEERGYAIVQDTLSADFVVINTCAFLEASRAEAVDAILRAGAGKRPGQKLVVCGCLPQRYIAELKDSLPEADAFLGVEAGEGLIRALDSLDGEACAADQVSPLPLKEEGKLRRRVLTTPPNVAYLKAADGCDNRCTYCLIPSIRGRYRSVPMEALLAEAGELAEEGVSEFVLVAQDLTRYGLDLYGEPRLVELIRRLSELQPVWIRLLYCYPESVTDALIAEIRDNPRVAKYIDIPLQHVSDRILKRMGRRSDRRQIENLISRLRREVPGISIRSTFIVGFPGETEEEFEELLVFLREHRLEHTGFFAYSDEEDAPSFRLGDKLPEAVKEERLLRAMAAAAEIQREMLDGMVGKRFQAVCDGADFELGRFVGRTEGQAPDVDTRLLLEGACSIESGAYYTVEIAGRDREDLIARIVEGEERI